MNRVPTLDQFNRSHLPAHENRKDKRHDGEKRPALGSHYDRQNAGQGHDCRPQLEDLRDLALVPAPGQKSMMEMLLVRNEEPGSILLPAQSRQHFLDRSSPHRQQHVKERNPGHRQGQEDNRPHRPPPHQLGRHGGDKQAEHHGSRISEEQPRGMAVIDKKPHDRPPHDHHQPDTQRSLQGDPGQNDPPQTDPRKPPAQTIQPIDQVVGIHQEHNPGDPDQTVRPERHLHADDTPPGDMSPVNRRYPVKDSGGKNLSPQLHPRPYATPVVHDADNQQDT